MGLDIYQGNKKYAQQQKDYATAKEQGLPTDWFATGQAIQAEGDRMKALQTPSGGWTGALG